MDWQICLSACVGSFIGMGAAMLIFGRPIRVNITMPKPIVTINAHEGVVATGEMQ